MRHFLILSLPLNYIENELCCLSYILYKISNIEKCFLMVKYNDKYVGYMKTCKDGIYVHKSSNMVCLVDICLFIYP